MSNNNDKTLRVGLYMSLLKRSPTEIIRAWLTEQDEAYKKIPPNFNYDLPKEYPNRYSIDDACQVSEMLKYNYLNAGGNGIFKLIFDFAKQTLIERNHKPFLRYEEILRWRDTTHKLGTTPFLCAFLAQEDSNKCEKRAMFSFNPVLETDNRRLKSVLSKGMAENHFHLKGSAPSFLMSWICLMNDMKNRRASFETIDKVHLSESMTGEHVSFYVLVIKAAAIRAFLFARIKNIETSDDEFAKLRSILETETPIDSNVFIKYLQNEINALKDIFGKPIKTGFYPDYALNCLGETGEEDTLNIFSGEYNFQYNMLRAIWEHDVKLAPYFDLFYAYLCIWIKLRSELVQSNNNFGFQNFGEFDDRKSGFLEGRSYFEDTQKKVAILTNLNDKRIKYLEARIVPKETLPENERRIKEIDNLFFHPNGYGKKTYECNQKKRMFYVLHIPKRPDCIKKTSKSQIINCRHHSFRLSVVRVIKAIIKLREGCDPAAERIKGIDACANEIYTRPEVFAPAYRQIKNHQPKYTPARDKSVSMVNVTYHVGEDFLDVADGLRAIWEAVEFLELNRSDRIGHGLALGIDAAEWYVSKQSRIFLKRQDLLDNVVWLLVILSRYGELDSALENELKQVCSTQYAAIYQSTLPFQEREMSFDQDNYFYSIELRGDNPYCYFNYQDIQQFIEKLEYYKLVHPYNLRDDQEHSLCYEIRRYNLQAIRLFHHYHFNPETKLKGSEVVEYQVSERYVKAVIEAQKILQKIIAEKGIGIETNPSSNVLIGNFNRYDKHPITNFNDLGLFNNPENPNLFVSINTDDQGVFDTCLENEYALLARSLEQMTDANGNALVSADRIYGWLDHVRQMGIDQSFFND